MSKNLAIYYGTMTGNAELLAQRAQDAATGAGWSVQLHNLADTKPDDLTANAQTALFVVSTWGDGEPPADAEDFFAALSSETPSVGSLRYTVFGLGDSDYEQFNGFAKHLDARLAELGAHTFLARGEADRDFEEAFAAWEPSFLEALNGLA